MLFMYNLIIILTGFLMFYLGAIINFMSEKTQNLREFLYFSKLFSDDFVTILAIIFVQKTHHCQSNFM